MNTYEIDDAAVRWALHPVLGPASRTLANLRDAVNRNSDGWAYWRPPVNAAAKLMDLVEPHPREHADATEELYRKALRPIKAFRTKSGLQFEIEEPGQTFDRFVERHVRDELYEIRDRLDALGGRLHNDVDLHDKYREVFEVTQVVNAMLGEEVA
jgi:hypothetical protein